MATPEIGVKVGVVEMASDTVNDVNGDDEDEDDDGDDDATNAKQRANRNEAVSYGPNDDEDDQIQQDMEREAEIASDDEDMGNTPRPRNGSPAHSDDEDEDEDEDDGDLAKLMDRERKSRVVDTYAEVTDFSCDGRTGDWCNFTIEYDAVIPKVLMLNLVQDAIKKTVVQEIAGVGACTFVEEKGVPMIHTSGVNLQAMQRYSDFINPNKIQTNDIAAVLQIYGVEAARNSIVGELAGVFGSHGIKVDNRHLNLIGDHMTRNGGFTPFNRLGLRGNVSPFTKMSFETTLAFLKDAVLDGDWDDLTTPSSRLVMGRLGKVGTGGFDVLTQLPTFHNDSLA